MASGMHEDASADGPMSDVRHLELLAHYECSDPATGNTRSGFAVILELTERRVLLEGDVALQMGDVLNMNFFLPSPGQESGRTSVSLECLVAQCRDTEKLHFSVRVAKIGEKSKLAIQALQKKSSGEQR